MKTRSDFDASDYAHGRSVYWACGGSALIVVAAVVFTTTSGIVVDVSDGIKYSLAGLVGVCGLFFITRSSTAALVALVSIVYLNISNILIIKYGLPSINKVLIPLMLVLMLYWVRKDRHQPPALPVAIAVALIYFSFVSSSLLYTDYPDLTLEELNKVIKDLIILVIIAGLLNNRRDLQSIVWALVLSATFLSTLSVINAFTGDISQDFFGFATWDYELDDYGELVEARIGGNLYSPNYYAQILLLAAPMAVNRAIFESRLFLRYCAVLCALLIVAGVLVTLSRSGLIILVLMFVVNALIVVKSTMARTTIVIACISAVSLVIYLAPDEITERVQSIFISVQQIIEGSEIEDSAVKGRLHEMAAAMYMFLDHPIIGVGFSTYSGYFQSYALEHDMTVRLGARDAHCLYLEIAAEGGLVGLLVFCLVVGIAIYLCLKAVKHARVVHDVELAGLLLSLLIGYVAYLAAFVFLHDAWQRYFWLLTGIMIATANINYMRNDKHTRPDRTIQPTLQARRA